MTTPTPTHHVRIDPSFGFSLLADHNPERDLFMHLAATLPVPVEVEVVARVGGGE